ncbi:hypothetical protein PDG61_10270 [Mycolicibacterium sp. BiH015]|nr:hypothetical protein [Mycolicibacterium sp. BiH015]MDA2891293.1 hypothetical protein [Mycolicibacterium sp. BiH015]
MTVDRQLVGKPQDTDDPAAAVDAFLRSSTARHWQRELAVPVLAKALAVT